MANPYQQQVFQRKMVYLGLIVVLLGAAWAYRVNFVVKRAEELRLLETTRGDVELLGAVARTSLSGLRGFATSFLWMKAMEEKKKNQYSRLERTTKQLTRLQPHLISPWQFQSWNLAYNVSRECDRVADKYYYIARGIQLLAQGERRNEYQPELRRDIGFFLQHKIGQSDETNTHRSLFQLSCIPPVERNADDFKDDKGRIDEEKLRAFCERHPQLARRLHSPPLPYDLRREYPKFRCADADELIEYLKDNYNVPSLFVEKIENEDDWKAGKRRENALDRFPVLPPQRDGKFNPDDLADDDFVNKPVPDEYDAYTLAQAWYGYAQECLPPPGEFPGQSQPVRDRAKEKIPKNMATTLFRSAPARSQSFVAERLQEEGWYDAEQFEITGWFSNRGSDLDRPLTIGVRRNWSGDAWEKSHRMWTEFGRANHLLLEEAEKARMERLVEEFKKEFVGNPGETKSAPDPTKMDDRQLEMFNAARFMREYNGERSISNIAVHLMRANVERKPAAIEARKLFYQAEQLRLVQQAHTQALEKYENPGAMEGWKAVLEQNPEFRANDLIQEQTYETELRYLRLYRRLNEDKLAPDLALLATLGQSMTGGPLSPDWALTGLFARPTLQPDFTIVGPLDKDSTGKPLVEEAYKNAILVRRGLKKAGTQPQQPPPGGGGRPPAGR